MSGHIEHTVDLPYIPSQLLNIAIDDGRALDKHRYFPDAQWWHMPQKINFHTVCTVCLAGAVIAKTLVAPHTMNRSPARYRTLQHQLLALDEFRKGNWLEGMHMLHLNTVNMTIDQNHVVASLMPCSYRNYVGWDEFYNFLDELSEVSEQLEAVDL